MTSPDTKPSPADMPAALRPPGLVAHERGDVVRCGAELVELSERFYRGVFIGAVIFVTLASIAALALLPTRSSVESTGPPVTVALAVLLIVAAPLAIWQATALYRLLRREPRLELIVLGIATALLVYPLRSELWWPACGLLMLLAMLAPLQRALAYCLAALLANVAAHLVAGDITDAPPVAIIGLWVGLVFWTATFGLITDRLATAILRLNIPAPAGPSGPVRVAAWSPDITSMRPSTECDRPAAVAGDAGSTTVGTNRLTARQMQIVALLADGLRYRAIGACLSISERQVQRHVSNAIARLGVASAGELVAVAVAEGMVLARGNAGHPESARGHADVNEAR